MITPLVDYKMIRNDVYPFDILVSFQSNKDFKKTLKKCLPIKYYNEIENSIGNGNARTTLFSNNAISIKFNNIEDINHGHIAHEIFHAVSMMFDNINMKLSSDSDEAYAYFIQYVTNEIYKLLKVE